jgi:non-ribosomal peptide synthetase-like protein
MDILHSYFEKQCDQHPDKICLICDGHTATYKMIDESANQLANWLVAGGIKSEDTIGVLVDRSLDFYIAMLAVLKAGAAYVPIDPTYPSERIEYIIENSKMRLLLTSKTYFQSKILPAEKIIEIERIKPLLETQSKKRPQLADISPDNLCYVIYTSGTTGRPKGVAITHQAVCNYVKSALDIYGITSNERVYQGFSMSFDASIEEIWLAFAAGGTLITSSSRHIREGAALTDFLNFHEITVFSTVPTILAMLTPNVPSLRVLILGGEICLYDLISPWIRPNLRIFNTYGPSEATIICTYLECEANKKVTIGKPLPNFEILVLNEKLQPVAVGTPGELVIGGIGLARGYINNDELTKEKFIPHINGSSKRLYRTGDQVSITKEGEIEYLGRLDEQVKLRGFRIELQEIENVIRQQLPNVRDVAVTIHESVTGMQLIAAYLVLKPNTNFNIEESKKTLGQFLPAYMIPSLFEILPTLPKLSTGKIDKKSLPTPTLRKISDTEKKSNLPHTEMEKNISDIWKKTLKISSISVNENFFTELGGNSLAAAIVVSEMRNHKEIADVSLVDLFENPTIRQLAKKLDSFKQPEQGEKDKHPLHVYSKNLYEKVQYFFCTLIQAICALVLVTFSSWHFFIIVLIGVSLSLSFFNLSVLELCLLWMSFLFLLEPGLILFSVLIKWLLLGKIKPGQHKVWSWYYLRWWVVNQCQDLAPVDHLVGSPFIKLYCRLMGAKIGKNCFIGTDQFNSFDLTRIGDNSSVCADVFLSGFTVEDGWLKIGSITIGDNCFVGANSVLGINTRLENGSKLAEQSLLPEGKIIPVNGSYVGSPARPNIIDLSNISDSQTTKTPDKMRSKLGNFFHLFSHYCLLMLLEFVYVLAAAPGIVLIIYFCYLHGDLINCLWAIPVAALLYIFLILSEIFILKRIFGRIKKGNYPIKSYAYLKIWFIERLVALSMGTVEQLYGTIYSSTWFRLLGAKIGKNSELATVGFTIPDMLNIGNDSFIADSTILAPTRVYKGWISVEPVYLGDKVFIGNGSLVLANTTIGDNSLIGVSSLSPTNTVPENTSWIGTPPLYLPQRYIDPGFSETDTYKPPMRAKVGRGILEALKIFLPALFLYIILTMDIITFVYLRERYNVSISLLVFPFFSFLFVLAEVLFIVLLKWLLIGRYSPTAKSMWTSYVCYSEMITGLFDTIAVPFLLEALMGTPFMAFFLRLFGTKIGKNTFINTPYFLEFDLTEIGDEVSLNRESTLQTHLYEDRIFKTSNIIIEKGCSVGTRSIVLYDSIMKEYSTLGDLSLLMKKEILYPNSYWEGVPAKRVYKSKHN